MLEYWSNAFASTPILPYSIIPVDTTFHHNNIPSLQFSITPVLLLAWIAFRHVIEETFLFELLQKTQVNKLLGFGVLCLGHLLCQHVQHELNAFESRIGLLRDHLDIALVRIFENGRVAGPHVLGEKFLGVFFIGVNEVDGLNESFQSGFDSVPIALNVGARRGKTVALNLNSQIRNLEKLNEAGLSCRSRGRGGKKCRIDFPGSQCGE